MTPQERRIYHLKGIVDSGESTPLHWDMLKSAQRQMAAKILEDAGDQRTVHLDKRQLPFLNYRDFADTRTLAVGKYRLAVHKENGLHRVDVWKPSCPMYGLSNQPPSRLPKYIKEFIEL